MDYHYPIVVVGAGAGGLVIAIGAAKAGKKVLLIEKGQWGGDCTNFGCVPSKSLIASAEIAYHAKGGDGPAIMEHVRQIVRSVRSHEEPEALEKMGVATLEGTARFIDPHTLEVSGTRVTAGHIVLATGSSPMIPTDIEGLGETPYLTNETIFDLKDIPKRLCVVGGGPIGCELAQAFCRLGSQVTQIHRRPYLLKKEEPEAQQIIATQFEKEGIRLLLERHPQKVFYAEGEFTILTESEEVKADHLLISVGRKPNVGALSLNAAGVDYSEKGIFVDKYGRTNRKHIWALGDVLGGPQFTHYAEHQARAVLTSLLLPVKKKCDDQFVPRATFTDPEVASFGYLEKGAREAYGEENIATYHVPMSENDRAITAGRTEGFVKVITKKRSSRILGATIVAPRAGEMLPELSLAAKEKIKFKRIRELIHPYPTYNLAIRKASDLWLTKTFLPWLRKPSQWIPWRRFIPLVVIAIFMIIAFSLGLQNFFTFSNLQANHILLKEFVSQYPVVAPLLFMLIYAIATSLSLPGGAILSLIGGFLFPVPWSTLYVLIGATTGASVIFLAARTALGEVLRKRAGPFLKKMEHGFQKNAWSYLLFLRFIPVFPFWLVNIAPALFNVSFLTYIWTTFVGIIPGAYVFTQTGAGLGAIFETGETFSLNSIFNVQIRIALIALAFFSLVPVFVKKWLEKRKNRH